jgi:hypothetical protein
VALRHDQQALLVEQRLDGGRVKWLRERVEAGAGLVVLAGSQSQFLAANLYARSIFGEDALVNISVEHRAEGTIKGHIRIRAKTQGVALSLGDRLTSKQKV